MEELSEMQQVQPIVYLGSVCSLLFLSEEDILAAGKKHNSYFVKELVHG
jgi:hypothetical protein